MSRARLTQKLEHAVQSEQKCILVVAPAGFGKTTLVVEWLAGLAHPSRAEPKANVSNALTAWLSLDEADNDLTRFLTYLLAALEPLASSSANWDTLVQRLSEYPAPPPEAILTPVLNTLAPSGQDKRPRLLVLDDYHVIHLPPIHAALTFLIEHLPRHWHVILTSRADPSLALARWRAHGVLGEVRAAQLCFTLDEATSFLNDTMALELDAAQVAALETRTEGWIAGLQLAGIALSNTEHSAAPADERARFISAFTGTHRVVSDYLMEEVLQRQPVRIQEFLLQTSILERLNAPLCDAVQGGGGGAREILEELERDHLFVTPLDEAREWYRYHPLWRDALRHRLQQNKKQIRALHVRAGEWFQANGFVSDAIEHAFASDDLERVVRLIEWNAQPMIQRSEFAPLREWFARLPDAVFETHPRLCLDRAWWLFLTGARHQVDEALPRAERALANAALPEEQAQSWRGEIETLRSAIVLERGDLRAALDHAERARTLVGDANIFIRGLPEMYAALAKFWGGQVLGVDVELAHAAERATRAGNFSSAFTASCARGEVLLMQGHASAALQYLRQLEHAAKQVIEERRPFVALLYVNLGMVYFELNDQPACRAAFTEAMELSEFGGMPRPREWLIAVAFLAWLEYLKRDRVAALALIARAEEHLKQYRLPAWAVSHLIDTELGIEIWDSDFDTTRRWLERRELAVGDEPTYVNELAQVTAVRVQIMHREFETARTQVVRMCRAAEHAQRNGSLIRLYTLEALLFKRMDEHALAQAGLDRALAVGETEGLVRGIIDEGATIGLLLQEKLKAPPLDLSPRRRAYIERLLTEMQRDRPLTETSETMHAVYALPRASSSEPAAPLNEALSVRELQVLGLVFAGYSNSEIAAQLVLSLGTVKTHINNIYRKLDAASRTQAVKRARDLGLLK